MAPRAVPLLWTRGHEHAPVRAVTDPQGMMKDSQQKIPQVRSRSELLFFQHSVMTPSRDSMVCGAQISADALQEGKGNARVRAETDSTNRRVMCGRSNLASNVRSQVTRSRGSAVVVQVRQFCAVAPV